MPRKRARKVYTSKRVRRGYSTVNQVVRGIKAYNRASPGPREFKPTKKRRKADVIVKPLSKEKKLYSRSIAGNARKRGGKGTGKPGRSIIKVRRKESHSGTVAHELAHVEGIGHGKGMRRLERRAGEEIVELSEGVPQGAKSKKAKPVRAQKKAAATRQARAVKQVAARLSPRSYRRR